MHLKDSDFVPVMEYGRFSADPEEWEVFEDSFHVTRPIPALTRYGRFSGS